MKTRPKPGRTRMAEAAALALKDNRVQRAIEARVKWLKNPSAKPEDEPRVWRYGGDSGFNDDEIYAILALSQKEAESGQFDLKQFIKMLDGTTPVLSRPRMTNRPLDLLRMLRQPETSRLWANWNGRTGESAPDPGYFVKALLVCTAALGVSAHFIHNYKELSGEDRHRDKMPPLPENPVPTRIQVVFDWIERRAARIAGTPPQPFGFKSYGEAMRQCGVIVDVSKNERPLMTEQCVSCNIEMLRWLSVTYPTTCVLLGIDGMLIKAWVPQKGKREDPEEERRIRGPHAPNASARYIPGRNGKPGRFSRGYYLYALVDLATNLTVVWGLWPGGDKNYEVPALRFLLNELFDQWPECPTTHIVADRAWDIRESIRDCAVRFGIHLVVGRDKERADEEEAEAEAVNEETTPGASDEAPKSPPRRGQRQTSRRPVTEREPRKNPLNEFDYQDIAAYDRFGNAYCRHCCDEDGEPRILRRKSYDFLGPEKRRAAGLKPGDAARDGSAFRVFFECTNPSCPGKARKRAIRMRDDWAAFSAYPHSLKGGRADLHAFRLALYARRNSCEALFGALKLGHKLGLDGSDRTHTPNELIVETLLSIALVLRTAFVLAHERVQQGGDDDLPADLYEALAAAR